MIASANVATLIQSQAPALLAPSRVVNFAVPSQQPSVPVAVAYQSASNLGGTLSLHNNLDPALIASIAPTDADSYHLRATNALFSDPLLGDLFKDVL